MLHDAIIDNLKVHGIEVTAPLRLLFPTASEVQQNVVHAKSWEVVVTIYCTLQA